MSDDYIPLDRSFYELKADSAGTDEDEYRRASFGKNFHWKDLLDGHRTLLLSEAGAGKTEELRQITLALRREQKAAFFLRLEHVADDFDIAFEEGTAAEFSEWLASDSEGWLFLDSIDEARLGEPKDFEKAIRHAGKRLLNALQRVHIVLSGRSVAWRPVTDLALCTRHLSYHPPLVEGEAKSQGATSSAQTTYRIFALEDLSAAQIEKFAEKKNVQDVKPFMAALAREDAWSSAARPDDLVELVAFWIKHKRIGDRLELVQANIRRRLCERDQERAEAMPLSETDALSGARQLAAAATMAQTSLIRVPDGSQNAKGLPAAQVLPDWEEPKLTALLQRPIFDEAIYGAVRFHHRDTREFLTAEWLQGLLAHETSRRKVEAILFRKQYGLDVIVRNMRPVLVWLILMDPQICARALAISPEPPLEGGEPKALPLDTRRTILRSVCNSLLHEGSARPTSDYRAVQRFAAPDIADDVKSLLAQYAGNDDLKNFLVRIVWQGELKAALPEAFAIASDPKTRVYTRVAAIRAVRAIGAAKEMGKVRHLALKESCDLKRELVAELIDGLPSTADSLDWLISALEKVAPKERFSSDNLSDALNRCIDDLNLPLIARLVEAFAAMLGKPPYADILRCKISQRHGWLIKNAARAIERLVAAKRPEAIEKPATTILQQLPFAQNHRNWHFKDIGSELPALIEAWPELNDTLFWQNIERSRSSSKKDGDGRVTKWWQAGFYRASWQFGGKDFERVVGQIAGRELLDDRLVALSLAFRLYTDAKRPRPWLALLKRTTADTPELREALHEALHPKPDEQARKWRKQEAQYARRNRLRKTKTAEAEQKSKEYLQNNFELLRDPKLAKPDAVTSAQVYCHDKMREASTDSGHWSSGNWRSLESIYGKDVAHAFRDGVVAYWRRNNPRMLSEGKTNGSTPFTSIFGLTGITIEARETENWPSTLSATEATLATRYAMQELNGFPDWLSSLHEAHPSETMAVLIKELDYNLKIETRKIEQHYVLSDLSWAGAWAWPILGADILKRLKQKSPKHENNLDHMLTILQGSPTSDADIADLAQEKCIDRRLTHAARWYAVWAGVEPGAAIPALKARLDSTRPKSKTTLAMLFVTALLGSRRTGQRVRDAFRQATTLKELYLLMQEYIRQKDDIDRAGKGVYSPGLRDRAQDARHALFSLLQEIPGKEAYVALAELGRLHPDPSSRPWMLHHARTKAELDAELTPWTIPQTLEFHRALESTPRTHRELFDLSVLRFLDLKDELELGDSSIADILIQGATQETQMRKFIGGWCRDRAQGRYTAPQEEEFADAKRADLRFHGVGFDAPVPIELKLADKWSGKKLFERLENQLCGDYLRDNRSNRGLFVLVRRGEQATWKVPGKSQAVDFEGLVLALQDHWQKLSNDLPKVDDVMIVGIDLTLRGKQ